MGQRFSERAYPHVSTRKLRAPGKKAWFLPAKPYASSI
jgi:hypothetical protein